MRRPESGQLGVVGECLFLEREVQGREERTVSGEQGSEAAKVGGVGGTKRVPVGYSSKGPHGLGAAIASRGVAGANLPCRRSHVCVNSRPWVSREELNHLGSHWSGPSEPKDISPVE